MNYYDMVVAAARMVEKVNATRKEVFAIANRVCKAMGKPIEEKKFNQAYSEWAKASGSRNYRPVYA